MAAAGITICELTLNLSLNLHPCVRVAVMVVSDINDKLSPKKAPPATIATNNGRPASVSRAIPAAKGVNATIVPTEVPMESEMKHAARKIPPNNRLSGKSCRERFTVASIAPMALADAAKAPARIKIHIISIRFGEPAPWEYTFTLSSNGTPRMVATA